VPDTPLRIEDLAGAIGVALEKKYPRTNVGSPMYPCGAIPQQSVEDLAFDLVSVIAEIIQAWIDAGSERDVTMANEALFRAIYDELKGWSDFEKPSTPRVSHG
jgi:hypothetical protein